MPVSRGGALPWPVPVPRRVLSGAECEECRLLAVGKVPDEPPKHQSPVRAQAGPGPARFDFAVKLAQQLRVEGTGRLQLQQSLSTRRLKPAPAAGRPPDLEGTPDRTDMSPALIILQSFGTALRAW